MNRFYQLGRIGPADVEIDRDKSPKMQQLRELDDFSLTHVYRAMRPQAFDQRIHDQLVLPYLL